MAEAKVLQLRPVIQKSRDERFFREAHMKTILYAFARDLERERGLKPWRADKLRRYIEKHFDF